MSSRRKYVGGHAWISDLATIHGYFSHRNFYVENSDMLKKMKIDQHILSLYIFKMCIKLLQIFHDPNSQSLGGYCFFVFPLGAPVSPSTYMRTTGQSSSFISDLEPNTRSGNDPWVLHCGRQALLTGCPNGIEGYGSYRGHIFPSMGDGS